MKHEKLNGFNAISSVYDLLATLVFGTNIRRAQRCYLNEARGCSRALIIGGGTGWLLTSFLDINPQCEVWYVEASASMLERTRKRIRGYPGACVHFIHGADVNFPTQMGFDVVLVNFFFDMFKPTSLEHVILQIRGRLSTRGKLLVSDFVKNDVWWQRRMLKIMYVFFGVFCAIEAESLPDWQCELKRSGFNETKSTPFFASFIKSAVYQRN